MMIRIDVLAKIYISKSTHRVDFLLFKKKCAKIILVSQYVILLAIQLGNTSVN